MSKRSRKVRDRSQRNAEQQDTRLPTRRPTSSYVKRLMMEYHDTKIMPLAADIRVTGKLVGALMRLVLDKGLITETELLAAMIEKSDEPA
jgi:hypothetical protein